MQQVLPRAAFNGRYAVRPSRSLAGLGDQQAAIKGVTTGAGIATPVITGILASHAAATAAATGAPALIAGLAPSVAIPIIGAAIVGVTLLAITLIKNSGCGQTCVVTSQWANEAAELLGKNSDAYFSLPVPRTKAAQGVALANFDAIWAALVAQCGQPGTGDAGKRCVSDRERGACVWKQNRSGGHPGEPKLGECWNWFNGYRDPIANDVTIDAPVPVDALTQGAADIGAQVSGAFSSLSTLTGGISPLLLIGGGLLVFALMSGDKK